MQQEAGNRSQRATEATQRQFECILSTKYKYKIRHIDICALKRSSWLLCKQWIGRGTIAEMERPGRDILH